MTSIYPAIFTKEPNGYSVYLPDLDEATCGKDLNEAMVMAIDLLAGSIYGLMEDGEAIPEATGIEAVDIEAYKNASRLDGVEFSDCFVQMVSVDVNAYAREHFDKPVRKSVVVSAYQNEKALRYGINFSETLREALDAKIAECRRLAAK